MKTKILSRIVILFAASGIAVAQPTRTEVLESMHRATQYMMDSVSMEGAFVWEYRADRSRQWGELEAPFRTMVWMQPPGTPSVGHLLLDAYHATGDEYYYEQACKVAHVLIRVQHPEGGWNYVEDLAGEEQLRSFYATLGRQAWRMEEFQHYYGNCTFDDEATIVAGTFLLRLYVEKHDAEIGRALNRVIQFVLDSQYPHGGWPQRWPLRYDHAFQGRADYSSFVTLNDGVMMDNIDFLLQCYQALGRTDLREPILRAMYLLADLQQPAPLSGWADQYDPKTLLPAHARSYEPRSVNTSTTLSMMRVMAKYYRLTGDERFLKGLTSALSFVERQTLSHEYESVWNKPKRDSSAVLVPRFVSPDDGKPLFVHRVGSNAGNGHYYTDQDLHGTIAHYNSALYVNLQGMREFCEALKRESADSLQSASVLLHPENNKGLDAYYCRSEAYRRDPLPHQASDIIQLQQPSGAWLVSINKDSHPYKAMPRHQRRSKSVDFASTNQGDDYDTSPYYPQEPFLGISTTSYIRLMSRLIVSLLPE